MTISQIAKTESEDFITALNKILEIVDSLSTVIGDNNYLEIANNLKILFNNKPATKEVLIQYIEVARSRVANNPVVATHDARVRMKVKTKTEMLTDAQKLKSGYKICPKCDRLVRHISNHQFTDVCKRTNESKKVSQKTKLITTDNYMNTIHLIRGIFLNYNGFKRNMLQIKKSIE